MAITDDPTPYNPLSDVLPAQGNGPSPVSLKDTVGDMDREIDHKRAMERALKRTTEVAGPRYGPNSPAGAERPSLGDGHSVQSRLSDITRRVAFVADTFGRGYPADAVAEALSVGGIAQLLTLLDGAATTAERAADQHYAQMASIFEAVRECHLTVNDLQDRHPPKTTGGSPVAPAMAGGIGSVAEYTLMGLNELRARLAELLGQVGRL